MFRSVLFYRSFYGQFVCLLLFGWTDKKWWQANQRILQSTIRHAFKKLALGRIHCLCTSRVTGGILYSSLFSSLWHHPNQCCGVTHEHGPQYRSWGHLSWHLGTLHHWLGWCTIAKTLPLLRTYSLKNHSLPLSGMNLYDISCWNVWWKDFWDLPVMQHSRTSFYEKSFLK